MMVTPWEVKGDIDYGRLEKEFGIRPIKPLEKRLPNHLLFRRGIVFGHRDFERILDCTEKKKPFVMLTGLMPSGKFHIGHAMLAQQIIMYQGLGAAVSVCVADIEAYNMRGLTMEKLRETAIEEYLVNYIALGRTQKNLDFYFQSSRSQDPEKSNAYYRMVGMLAKRPTFNEMKAIYGDLSPGKIQSVLTQVADILHPQLPEFGGPKPVVVPIGADQDPHLRLTRDLASRMSEYKLIQPSSTYHKFMVGLKGGKMSSSDPLSYIALTDPPEEAEKKIMKYAFSGGRNSVEEHRKLGGDISVDVSYNMLYYMFEPDDKKMQKIRDDYTSGKMLSGELKAYLAEKVKAFLREHQKKRELAKKQVGKFLKG